jgi:hypothetical protein
MDGASLTPTQLLRWSAGSAEWSRFVEYPHQSDLLPLAWHLGVTVYDVGIAKHWNELISKLDPPGIAMFDIPTVAIGHAVYVHHVHAHWAVFGGHSRTDLPTFGWPWELDTSGTTQSCSGSARIQVCGRCGQPARIAGRAADGAPLCPRCQPRPLRTCHCCGNARPAAAITGDGPVCHRCYRSPSRPCGGCGQVRPVKRRAGPSSPDLCSACYRGPVAQCSVCYRMRPCSYATGKPVCPSCAPLPLHPCCRCAKQWPVKARWPIGPVCAPCYSYIRSHPTACHVCGTAQPLIARASSGELICGPCAGLAVDYGCRRWAQPDPCSATAAAPAARCTTGSPH